MTIDELKALEVGTQEDWVSLFGADFDKVGYPELAKIDKAVFTLKALAPEILALVEAVKHDRDIQGPIRMLKTPQALLAWELKLEGL